MSVSVLVPYRPDGGWRDRTWVWVRQRIRQTLPDAQIMMGGRDLPGDGPAAFNHPQAINRAAARATGDVLVIEDTDTAFDPQWLRSAIDLVGNGQIAWTTPTHYEQLTQKSTLHMLGRPPTADIDPNLAKVWVGERVSWAGLIVVPREAFEMVGGYDERFTEWGGDDVAFATSLNTLWGQCMRLTGAATHFWHPRDGLDAQPRSQHDLMHRYLRADGDEAAMRQLRTV